MKRLIMTLSIGFLFFTGCATSYQPNANSFTGGFSETILSEDTFIVNFKGNAYTSKERATDFTLLRSSELTLNNGYKYFIIVDIDYDEDISVHKTAPKATTTFNSTTNIYGQTNFNANQYGNNIQGYSNANYNGYTSGTATTTYKEGETHIYKKPLASYRIICFKEKINIDKTFYDANFISQSIKQKYSIR